MAELIDIFNDDAFSVASMTDAIEEVDYVPDYLETLNLFPVKGIRSETVGIETKSGGLSLIQTSLRGEPLKQAERKDRVLRHLQTVRLAKSDKITASELGFVRALGTADAIQEVQKEFSSRMSSLRDDMAATHENMRLAAVQGKLVDADGAILYDYFDEFDITAHSLIAFDLANTKDGNLRKMIAQKVLRPMKQNAKGARYTEVHALCGDNYWDDLIANPEVRGTYETQLAGHELRQSGLDFVLDFGGVKWKNYQGTDDGSTVAVDPDKCVIFPGGKGAKVFETGFAPGESFSDIGTKGKEVYALQLLDQKRGHFVDLELYSYPLFFPRRPKMLFSGKRGA